MRKNLGRTQLSASHRLTELGNSGHQVNIEAGFNCAIVTLTRKEGTAHHVTMSRDDLPFPVTESDAYKRHPQSVLLSHAIHAVADWSEEYDRSMRHECLGCSQEEETQAIYNRKNNTYDWYCPTCLYGEAA